MKRTSAEFLEQESKRSHRLQKAMNGMSDGDDIISRNRWAPMMLRSAHELGLTTQDTLVEEIETLNATIAADSLFGFLAMGGRKVVASLDLLTVNPGFCTAFLVQFNIRRMQDHISKSTVLRLYSDGMKELIVQNNWTTWALWARADLSLSYASQIFLLKTLTSLSDGLRLAYFLSPLPEPTLQRLDELHFLEAQTKTPEDAFRWSLRPRSLDEASREKLLETCLSIHGNAVSFNPYKLVRTVIHDAVFEVEVKVLKSPVAIGDLVLEDSFIQYLQNLDLDCAEEVVNRLKAHKIWSAHKFNCLTSLQFDTIFGGESETGTLPIRDWGILLGAHELKIMA